MGILPESEAKNMTQVNGNSDVTAEREGLIHDWNEESTGWTSEIQLNDETLRDGLQSPSALDPDLGTKIELVHLMDQLGINTANIGLPGAGERARDHILGLATEMRGLSITPNVACRTMIGDIEPAAEIQQKVGAPVEICAFIGSSPIRFYTENWEVEKMVQLSSEAVAFAVKEEMPVMFVTEDTTRANPETLRALYGAAIDAGATRLCICDTCGHASPTGVRKLIRFVKGIAEEKGVDVGIDWHGHRDRGLGLINALVAIEAGATRIHGTALGIGERAGNTEMDLLIVNLALTHWIDRDLTALGTYVQKASDAIGIPFPDNYPVFGSDAFETATGVHAAAVVKAFRKGDAWLADRVYSGVPAGMFGLEQKILVGPMSGKSNVSWVLEKNGVEATDERIQRVLEVAKRSKHNLSDAEVVAAAAS
ncbi:2-isopropylmalate synthase [Planctomycetes bacterium Poly30]|uniref:2-isopropylmalate synthase n=2 Tax=Saltatorellus ferox TaxID=2528018 RepID=A0A518ELM5_9BACT|nr:2-isopropylmalate synthase [Planctomycetes bacterium Poly30]